MFLQTFRPIAAHNPGSAQPMEVDQVVEAQKMRIVNMLLQGKTYGLPGSDGKRWGNFREWAKNQHPVLSMFFAHELHPFSRTERFSVLLCYLSWAFLITCIFEQMNYENEKICDRGCERTFIDETTQQATCGVGSGDNSQTMTTEQYHLACDEILPWYVLSFTIAACTVPYSTILKVLATCGCVQALPHIVKNCFEFLGTIMLAIFGFLSFVWLGIGISISLTLDGGMFMVVYMAGVAKSWMYWPFLAGFMFLWRYKKAKRLFEEENPGQLALAWPIDGQDIDLEITLGPDGKPIAYQSPPQSPREQEREGKDLRKTFNITAPPGSPQATPEATPCPQQYDSSGIYSPPPPQPQEQYYSPPSPAHGFATAPPPPPAENPYRNDGGAAGQVGGAPSSPLGYGGGGSPAEQYRAVAGYGMTTQGYGGSPAGSPPVSPGHGRGGGLLLPPGWEAKVLPEGRTLFIDHNTQTTHWDPPVMQPPSSPPSYHQHQAARGQQQQQHYHLP